MSASDRPGAEASTIARMPLLRLMPSGIRELVSRSLVPVSYGFGEVIVREGEGADAFYLLVSGTARALRSDANGGEVSLNVIHPGEGFGELGLLEDTTRSATVRAREPVEALRLERSVFRQMVALDPAVERHFRLAIEQHKLRDFLKLFSPFARLPADTLEMLIAALRPVEAGRGGLVARAGDPPAPLHIIREGRVRLFREQDGERVDLAYLRKGEFFGERALLRGTPQTVYAEAVVDCRLLALPPADFDRLVEQCAVFRALVEERIQRYDYQRVARVPLDFSEEIVSAAAAPEAEGVADEADAGPPAELPAAEGARTSRRLARRRRARRFPHVWQVDERDAGAACLAMVCRHFGRPVSLAHIRRLIGPGVDGTSMAGIAAGARAVGLEVRTLRAAASRLDELPLPAVVHVRGAHWAVLHAVEGGHVRVADPARGPCRLPRGEFLETWSGYAVLLGPGPGLSQAPLEKRDFGWMWTFVRPHRRRLALAAMLAVVGAGLQLVAPVSAQFIVDKVLVERNYGLLSVLVFALAAMLVTMTVASVAERLLLSRVAVRLDGAMLDFITGRLLALPMSYFQARRTGDIQRRFASMRQVREFVIQNAVRALTAAATLLAAVVLMFVYDWLLALAFVGAAPLYGALMRFSRRRLRPMFDSLEEAFGRYHSQQIDAIKGIEAVKALAAERSFQRRAREQFDALSDRLERADFTIMAYEGAVQLVSVATLALFLWLGALRVLEGALTVGELVSFNALVLLASPPIIALLSIWDDLQFSAVLVNRLDDIIEHEPEQGTDRSRLRPVAGIAGAVRLERLEFSFGGPRATPVLRGIDLDVEAGATVAIVGRSGSGKTTLVRCLAGLLEPTAGRVLFDGADARTLDRRQLRRQIGYVLQESHLFDDTIARNIAFGADAVDDEQVRRAARTANAHDFIERLPLGYETLVGEGGVMLSGGQRQRIAIARALYHRPPVLIFDEATSALDTESERAVQANLDLMLEGRTSFVIAHRLSTIRDADLIVVLDKGRIAERGDHGSLMKRRGIYYYLCSQQLDL